ncbi:MAG: type II secretion system major pseudopilin GspG [Methylococcales bacterium]
MTDHLKYSGFTLIELLVVLAIIGLLAGLVGPQVMKQLSGAKSKTAKVQISDLSQAMDMYRLDVGSYPSSDQGLAALVANPGDINSWNGPYLSKVPKDPWNNEYLLRSPGEHGNFDLYSLGLDNTQGGEGENRDVTSWE